MRQDLFENKELNLELEEALTRLRRVLMKVETLGGGMVDYAAWSEARGSKLGEIIQALKLPSGYVQHCEVVPSRYELLPLLPVGGCVAEIGTQFGQFAGHIANIACPENLHLFDLSFDQYNSDHIHRKEVQVHCHEGDSSEAISQGDFMFDWVYLDADHSYEGVLKDLHALNDKIVPGGLIICNDYIPWSPLEALIYGVPKAVHEFCLDEGWGFRYLALHPWGYHDVALMRMNEIEST